MQKLGSSLRILFACGSRLLIHFNQFFAEFTIYNIDAAEIDEQNCVFGNYLSLLIKELLKFQNVFLGVDTLYIWVSRATGRSSNCIVTTTGVVPIMHWSHYCISIGLLAAPLAQLIMQKNIATYLSIHIPNN